MEKHLDTEYQKHLQQKKYMMMKKKRKRRMKRKIVFFLFLLVCAGIIVTVFKAPFFDINEIVCQGQDKLTAEQVIKISGVSKGNNIFITSISDAKENLLKNPEIRSASVNRVFPNRIRIEIVEAVPVAYAEYDGMVLLLDDSGKIIKTLEDKEDSIPDGLVKVIGVEVVSSEPGKLLAAEDDGRALKLYECLRVFESLGFRGKVNYVDFSDLSDIKLEYENRIYMLLGNYDSLEYKLKFVKKVIDEKIAKQEKARFDFRTEQLHVSTRADEQKNEDVNADGKTDVPSEPDKAASGKNAEENIADGKNQENQNPEETKPEDAH